MTLDEYDFAAFAQSREGAFPAARATLIEGISKHPDGGPLYLHFAKITPFASPNGEIVDALHAAIARNADVIDLNTAKLHFAMGKVYDDCELYDDAFAYYRRGNAICDTGIFSPDGYDVRSRLFAQTYNDSLFRQTRLMGSPSNKPVFVLGTPRSGTTLIASILSAHPLVASAGELPDMDVGNRITSITQEWLANIANAYLSKNTASFPDARFIIDKHPLNFQHIGLIHLLFPNAKIIHCARNAFDTCLSIYFQCFKQEHQYSFDLTNIARFYRAYVYLMQHWITLFPDKILTVNYEDVVADKETQTRRMLTFLGLDMHEDCLSHESTKYAPDTASLWQVRQPIYDRSVGRWKKYEKHLGELFSVFQQTKTRGS